ncbi:unnamed protein product [Arctia plantaginis]|uniref:Fatty acid desaturase domain-containing protein n=1 Tax=Arctia plantaginis TaxID=874455 RepID=A0A8S0ZDM5_ARCPL|nr:unnamed protein product [Arctia plantaginis]
MEHGDPNPAPDRETCAEYFALPFQIDVEDIFITLKTAHHVVWPNVVFFILVHLGSLHGIYLIFTKAKWQTLVFTYFMYIVSNTGMTAGVHRLWAHKAYKAKLPLKILLVLMSTIGFQGSVHQWVRDHRVHHKYSETDADPHNATRGFFFSHIGWLLMKKHPEVTAKGHDIDMSDLRADKLICLQKKYYYPLVLLLCFITPTVIPLLWGEEMWTAFFVAGILRYTFSLHTIFLVNSLAHMWGTKPYDKRMKPAETKSVSFLACGEGFHNYHHVFPWDYKAAEMGGYALNISRLFIDTMAKIGWAYDLKTVTEATLKRRIIRTGDGTHPSLLKENDSF